MNLQEEKSKLIARLAGLTDLTFIERIKFLKDNQLNQTDCWEEISKTEKHAIDQGLEDADNGKVTPHQEVRKRYEKWL